MHHDRFLLLGELECARKKFDVNVAGNVCELQMVLNGNESAPMCIRLAVVPVNVVTQGGIKNSEDLISLFSQVSVAMITSGEVVSTKTSILFPFLRILWQFMNLTFFEFFESGIKIKYM